ncbi:hypothetical protein Ga0100230_021585 [Opitutaceae bacterium TAV3]|nr:hypothetical protein Ga0100230_021585 [Opitutaceae bacterium TAV3]
MHSQIELQWTPAPQAPVQAREVKLGNQTAYQHNGYIEFGLPNGVVAPKGRLYAKVRYLDQGFGLIQVFYHQQNGSYAKTLRHTRSSRINTGEWVDSFHVLTDAGLGADGDIKQAFVVRIDARQGEPLTVGGVTIQTTPFDDLVFKKIVSESWKLPPPASETSPLTPPKSLDGTIMAGYQGWFGTPNDLNDTGWFHWFKSHTRADPQKISVDMWPETDLLPSSALVPAEGLKRKSGKPALLYSSTSPEIVRQHFRWLREHNIDGIFLERFGPPPPPRSEGQEWVLSAVRHAANAEGRVWALKYDIGSISYDSGEQVVERFKGDWIRLVDELKILEDKFYLRENGKPVVLFWGLAFPGRKFTQRQADLIVNFLQNDPKYGGNHVIGGIPNWWRTMPEWYSHFKKYDSLLPWQGWNRTKEYTNDRKAFAAWGCDYYAHIWPGFSHKNRSGGPEAEWPRYKGEYFWKQINQAIAEGNNRLYIGMLDEFDEGTAILPISDDPLDGAFFLNNEGMPSDWYLRLASFGKEILQGKCPAGQPMPKPKSP